MNARDRKDPKRIENTRRWFAIGLATVFMFLSYTLFIFGFAVISDEEVIFGGGLLGIGLGLVPGVFLIVAAVSNREHSIRAGLLATLVFFVVMVPIAIFDLPTALVAGFGFGGIIAVRREAVHSLNYRIAAVTICVVYTFVMQRISPAAGLMVGAITPLLAIAGADWIREREQAALEEAAG